MKQLILMNRTHEVCLLEYDENLHAITRVLEQLKDADHAPVGMLSEAGATASKLRRWWGNRAIPESRPGLKDALNKLGLASPQELAERNHGLSLSDQYWMRNPKSNIRWEDINYFDNDFSDETGRFFFSGRAAKPEETGAIDLNAPDNTSDGNLPKRWSIIEGQRCLIKGGGFLNQEPYNEVIASDLYRRLLDEEAYVPYRLHDFDGVTCSLCTNMLTNSEEYVPAVYIDDLLPYKEGEENLKHYLRSAASLGVVGVEDQVNRILTCDYIIANFDRHYRNFGLIRNVETLVWRVAPLFDSGSSLWCNRRILSSDSLDYSSTPFIGSPLLQLQAVSDLSWFKPEKMEGFLSFAVSLLREGPLHNYGMRLITLEDALEERMDRVIRLLQSRI